MKLLEIELKPCTWYAERIRACPGSEDHVLQAAMYEAYVAGARSTGYDDALVMPDEVLHPSVRREQPVACRRCSGCVGQTHHLMDDGTCKHCGIQAHMCDQLDAACLRCGGSGWYVGDDAPVVSEP